MTELGWFSLVLAGAVLGAAETALVFARAFGLFLSTSERLLYSTALMTTLALLALGVGALLGPALSSDTRGARLRAVHASAAALAGGGLGWLLTAGRRVRDLGARPLLVLLAAIVLGGLSWLVLRGLVRMRHDAGPRLRGAVALAVLGLGVAALGVDVRVLPRGYPAFHAALFASAVLCAAFAGLLVPLRSPALTRLRALAGLAGALVLGAVCLLRVGDHPNVGFIAREHGPFARKLLVLLPERRSAEPTVPVVEVVAEASARPLDLRDRDVLLVSVDALRADLLRAYGGTGLTPNMDALAAEGVVFERAYTPAPHTSYALASLLTAKFLKPVAELSSAPRDHVTLPDLLRRYGYRTAAFYPPAIFFVDGARFAPLHERAFGFEYLKEMYAPAPLRVTQLVDYLALAQPGHPLFVWIHLFEPHEPYEPSPSWTRRDSARARYEGEVADADRAFGDLVRAFRAQKPRGTVILTADHGEEFGEHGGAFHGSTLYDEQVRIPLVWSSPGLTPHTVSAPVELVDVGATLLATAFVPRDPRMRGDDLSASLRGDPEPAARYAFASVDDRTMVTDGKLKAVCAAGEAHCQLFDLMADPREVRSLTATRPADAERLRAVLDAFLRSIPAREALAVGSGVAFPESLARAELGVIEALPELLPLLRDARPGVRAQAARVLGERGYAPARTMLDALMRDDPEPRVRAEAAIAAFALGSPDAGAVRALLIGDDLERRVRAALALGRRGDAEAGPVLAQLARDARASEAGRMAAVRALGAHPSALARDVLVALLGEPRLGVVAAQSLRDGGFRAASDALAEALRGQRYPSARTAQLEALFAFGDARAPALARAFLGMDTSVPDGLALLEAHGEFTRPRNDGGLLLGARFRRGHWDCEAAGCVPGHDARVALRVPEGGRVPLRLVIAVAAAEPGSELAVGAARVQLRGGPEQLSVAIAAGDHLAGGITVRGGARLHALYLVPARDELPPPAPEPWDAGVPASEDKGAP